MIDDVDRSLAAMLAAELPRGTDVAFGPPGPLEEAARGRTVSLYLHDLREDLDRRYTDARDVRDDRGQVSGRRVPARRYSLSYLVTVRAADSAAEHRLLSEVLTCLSRHPSVPQEHLSGGLAEAGCPILLSLWPRRENQPGSPIPDVWSALGETLRPSIDLLVTSPLVPVETEEFGPPVVERVIEFEVPGGEAEVRREPKELVARRRAQLEEGTAPQRRVPEPQRRR